MTDRPPHSSGHLPGLDPTDEMAAPSPSGDEARPEVDLDDVVSVWASPLGRWLRGLIDDPSSRLPAMSRVIEASRIELEAAPALGVLFVRFESWGDAARLFGWREIQSVYEAAATAALDMLGDGLRRVDLPADLGLRGEGFAILLGRPRGSAPLGLEVVERVADRVVASVLDRLAVIVPLGLRERTTIEAGAGLVRRPVAGQTYEEALVGGLVEAERDASFRHEARLAHLGCRLRDAVQAEQLTVLYRPVVAVETGGIVGFDSVLCGPSASNLSMGDVLLDVAGRTGQEFRVLDRYHRLALTGAEEVLESSELLVLRATADELLESAVRLMSALYHRDRARLTPANVLFTVDSEGLSRHLPAGLSAWRSVGEMGFRLGVDLSPDRPLPLDYLEELHPDVIKIGGRSVHHVHRRQDEFEYLLMLSRFATRHDTLVLAADCSERREFETLRRAGVTYAEGDFVAPAMPEPRRPELKLL